jgi:choloylglycine hydrolase
MCTNLLLSVPSTPGQNEPRTHVSARCMEMPGVIEQSAFVVGSGETWPLVTSPFPVSNPLTWQNEYGFVAIAPTGDENTAWLALPTMSDGLNSEGLGIGGLWLAPGTEYARSGNQANQLSFLDFPAWVLGNFATVSDLRAAMAADAANPVSVVGPSPPPPADQPLEDPDSKFYVPLHYIVTDSTGASVVIEFIKGEPRLHHALHGVMTNTPTYDWHTTNQELFYNLTLVGEGTSSTGAADPVGAGLMGLPGDASSASRFTRAVTQSGGFRQLPEDGTGWLPAPGGSQVAGSKTPTGFADPEQVAVTTALQLVQQCMGTPYGMLLEPSPDDPTQYMPGDWTMWTCVRDHTNLKYYFVSAFSAILTVADLTTIDFGMADRWPLNQRMAILPSNAAWCQDVTWTLAEDTETAAV